MKKFGPYQDIERDANRYRAIKNIYSPFVVKDFQRHLRDQFALSPQLDDFIDEWMASDLFQEDPDYPLLK